MQQAFEEGFDQVRPGEFARGWVVGSLRAAALLLRARAASARGTSSGEAEATRELAVAAEAEALALAAVAVGGREARADAAATAALHAVVQAHDRRRGEGDEAAAEGRLQGMRQRAGELLVPGLEAEAGAGAGAGTVAAAGPGLDAEAGAGAGAGAGAALGTPVAELDAAASTVLARAAQLLGGEGPLGEGPVAAAVLALQSACESRPRQ